MPGLARRFLPAGLPGAGPAGVPAAGPDSSAGLLFPIVTPQHGGRRTGPGRAALAGDAAAGLLDSRLMATQLTGLAALAAAVALAFAGHRIRGLRAALATTAGLAVRAGARLRHPRATAAGDGKSR